MLISRNGGDNMKRNNKEQLEKRIEAWKQKVLASYDGIAVDTERMIKDIDIIIAEEFGHETVLQF